MKTRTFREGFSKLDKYGMRNVYGGIYMVVIILILLLVSAFRIDWDLAWYYSFYISVTYSFSMYVLIKKDPELMNERGKAIQAGTKSFDKIFFIIYRLLSILMMIAAGLDAGKRGSAWGAELIILGYLLHSVSSFLATWAMLENTHFETTVRIQKERDHKVITTGPYKIVRHPGYTASLIVSVAVPLVLGSSWAMAFGILSAAAFTVRTYLEDKTLQNELPGYKEYSLKTKYRLVPYIW